VLDDDSTRISRVLRTIVMPCNVIPSEYWVLSSDSNNGVIMTNDNDIRLLALVSDSADIQCIHDEYCTFNVILRFINIFPKGYYGFPKNEAAPRE